MKNMLFWELAEVEMYDGIWACSLILHLPMDELADVRPGRGEERWLNLILRKK